MMTTRAQITAGLTAQILAQVLTACALVAHLFSWPDVSIWVVVPLAAAAAVPFRHDGTLHDRAVGNFGASSVVAGFFAWELALGGVDGILGGGTLPGTGAFTLLTLTAAVLFSAAGAAFWLLREDPRRS
jgi:hypothetical protein